MAHEVLDVLIVGAGPTGLTLALELEAQGVPFRIVDKAAVRPTTSRSLVVHPRTLEFLNRHGDAHQLKQPGCTVKGATWFISPTSHPNFDFDGLDIIDTEFPNTMCVSQFETERYLETNLARVCGGKPRVEWSTTVDSVAQDGDGKGVTVTLSHGGGKENGEGSAQETLRCRYVVGCDGTHSVVRRAAKHIDYPGGTYEHEFILCDAVVSDTTLPRDRVLVILSKVFTLVFPLDGGKSFRITTARVPNPDAQGAPLLPTLAEFQTLLDSVVGTSLPPGTKAGTLHDPTWLARFKIHHRCATAYRDGRLLIAGDAAHIHSPIGGQGLNTSIQDAVNLGWKLAAVLQSRRDGGGEDPSASPLLDTYNEERRPVGLALLASTDRLFRFATMQNKFAVWLRNLLLSWLLPLLLGNKARRQKLFRVLAELTINYRGSSIVGTGKTFEGSIRGGDRLSSGRLVRITTDGEGGANGNAAYSTAENTTTLQRLCGATRHHLVLFAGPDNKGRKDEFALDSDLCQAAACVAAARADMPVSTIFAGDRAVPPMLAKAAYRDPGGEIHARYSFQKKPGYVLVRPDSYVAHIGYLSHLDELLDFFRKV